MYNVILMRRERERVNKKNTHTAELELQTADNLTCQQQSIYDVLCGPSFKSMIFSTSSKSAKQPNTVSKTQCVLPSDYQSRCFFYFFTSTSIISYIYISLILYIYMYTQIIGSSDLGTWTVLNLSVSSRGRWVFFFSELPQMGKKELRRERIKKTGHHLYIAVVKYR